MGVWEGLSPNFSLPCEVPDCGGRSVTAFTPAFESSGGWTGDHQEYDFNLNIAFVCEEHKPKRLKGDVEYTINEEMLHCEICGDERVASDLNSELRCPLCEEREDRNEKEAIDA